MHYGIREHGMGVGHERHGGARRRAARWAAPSSSSPTTCAPPSAWPRSAGRHVIYSWTHDSIGLGEDGPTHQPIEHLASLRAMPGLSLVRPADANETAQAWSLAVEADGPVGLVLTRQNVPVLAETAERAADGRAPGRLRAGRPDGPPEIVLVGTGSEVQHCVAAAADAGRRRRAGAGGVVPVLGPVRASRTDDYRAARLPAGGAGAQHRGRLDLRLGALRRRRHRHRPLRRVGPGEVVMEKFGFTADHVVERATALLAGDGG